MLRKVNFLESTVKSIRRPKQTQNLLGMIYVDYLSISIIYVFITMNIVLKQLQSCELLRDTYSVSKISIVL